MNPRLVLIMSATGRTALGATLLVAPGLAGSIIGNETSTATARVVTRVAGVRDLVIGVGTLRAVTSDRDPSEWVVASVVCDAVDSLAHFVAIRDLPTWRTIGTIIGASGAAGSQLLALRRLRAGAGFHPVVVNS